MYIIVNYKINVYSLRNRLEKRLKEIKSSLRLNQSYSKTF